MAGANGKQEMRATSVSLLFVIAGLLVVWLAQSLVKVETDAVVLALLLIPVLVYMVVSGRLAALKGPGGLEVTFARMDLSIALPTTIPMVGTKGIVQELDEQIEGVDASKPVVMTMELPEQAGHYNKYGPEEVRTSLTSLARLRNFKLVLFLDEAGRFVAYMPQWTLRGLLTVPSLGEAFIDVINDGDRESLLRYPGVIGTAISSETTNAEALRKMEELSLEALVVVDDRSPKGVVEREQILMKMMLALT